MLGEDICAEREVTVGDWRFSRVIERRVERPAISVFRSLTDTVLNLSAKAILPDIVRGSGRGNMIPSAEAWAMRALSDRVKPSSLGEVGRKMAWRTSKWEEASSGMLSRDMSTGDLKWILPRFRRSMRGIFIPLGRIEKLLRVSLTCTMLRCGLSSSRLRSSISLWMALRTLTATRHLPAERSESALAGRSRRWFAGRDLRFRETMKRESARISSHGQEVKRE